MIPRKRNRHGFASWLAGIMLGVGWILLVITKLPEGSRSEASASGLVVLLLCWFVLLVSVSISWLVAAFAPALPPGKLKRVRVSEIGTLALLLSSQVIHYWVILRILALDLDDLPRRLEVLSSILGGLLQVSVLVTPIVLIFAHRRDHYPKQPSD